MKKYAITLSLTFFFFLFSQAQSNKNNSAKPVNKNSNKGMSLLGSSFSRSNSSSTTTIRFNGANSGIMQNKFKFNGNTVSLNFFYTIVGNKLTIRYDKSKLPEGYDGDEQEYMITENGKSLVSTHLEGYGSDDKWGKIKYSRD